MLQTLIALNFFIINDFVFLYHIYYQENTDLVLKNFVIKLEFAE